MKLSLGYVKLLKFDSESEMYKPANTTFKSSLKPNQIYVQWTKI